MKIALLIHGAYGKPDNHWFPSVQSHLEDLGYKVFAPQFPTPEGQTLDNWMKVYKDLQLELNDESIVIGHSLGVPFLLNVLQELQQPIKAAYLVAGLYKDIGMEQFDPINFSFYENGFDWDCIRENCGSISIFHSDNDPYVPLSQAHDLVSYLDAEFVFIKNVGHFSHADYVDVIIQQIAKVQ